MKEQKEKEAKCEHIQTFEDELLNGLVGPRSVAVVNIETVPCQAIMDSGSQVPYRFCSLETSKLRAQEIKRCLTWAALR